jgi:GNAT superfamily N-acetyltransferase
MTEVIEVGSKRDLSDFIRYPFALYSHDPFYVPPLLRQMRTHFSQRNPFFIHALVRFFLAREKGNILGRVVSIINRRHNEFHREKAGFFGFYESANDDAISSALLDRVAFELKREGMDVMRGPMNFSTNEECGFLVNGFNSHPLLMTPYNPPYYIDLMEKYGLRKAKDLYAYILDLPDELPQKIHRVAELAAKTGITVRSLNRKHFERDMLIFKDVYNSAWARNWGFIPLTGEELNYLSHNLKPVIEPDLTLIAEQNGKPVGFMGMMPDFNVVLKQMKGKLNPMSIIKARFYSRKIKDLRMLLLGIKYEYRNKGVDALLFREGFRGVKRGGYRRIEFSWILEDNIPVQRLIEMIGARLYKTYRIYEQRL